MAWLPIKAKGRQHLSVARPRTRALVPPPCSPLHMRAPHTAPLFHKRCPGDYTPITINVLIKCSYLRPPSLNVAQLAPPAACA